MVGADGSPIVVNRAMVEALLADGESDSVPVDDVLYAAGFSS